MKKLILFGGKGGTGKSVISAATSVLISKKYKTYIISFDITHSLSDIFDIKIGDDVTRISHNLFAAEPDPNKVAEKSAGEILSRLRTMLNNMRMDRIFPSFRTLIDLMRPEFLPSAIKYTTLLNYIIRDEEKYDIVIADFPPTSSMFALLEFPKLCLDYLLGRGLEASKGIIPFGEMVSSILTPSKIVQGDSKSSLLREARSLREGARKVNQRLKEASLRLVTLPEKTSVNETYRCAEFAKNYTNLEAIYINRLIPHCILETSGFLGRKGAVQEKYIGEIRRKFSDKMIWEIPELEYEPIGLSKLEKTAKITYKNCSLDEAVLFERV
jgi:arsenite-transporting ATPase